MKSKFIKFFRHPITLLIIGSIITYFLIPWIHERVSKNENERREKLEIASRFIRQNMEMNQDFNSLLTSLELFHKYSSPEHLVEDKNKLRMASKEMYLKIDKNVWWWHWNLYEEAKLNKLIPESEQKYVENSLVKYTDSWSQIMGSLEKLWKACLDENYKQEDNNIDTLMNKTRKLSEDTRLARDSLIRGIISKFDIEK